MHARDQQWPRQPQASRLEHGEVDAHEELHDGQPAFAALDGRQRIDRYRTLVRSGQGDQRAVLGGGDGIVAVLGVLEQPAQKLVLPLQVGLVREGDPAGAGRGGGAASAQLGPRRFPQMSQL